MLYLCAMVNKVILVGNLGADPEHKTLESGTHLTTMPLATHENYRDEKGEWQQQTEWHNIVIWGEAAERAANTLKKGMTVYIEGKMKTNKWQDDEGRDRWSTEVKTFSFRLLDKLSDLDLNTDSAN